MTRLFSILSQRPERRYVLFWQLFRLSRCFALQLSTAQTAQAIGSQSTAQHPNDLVRDRATQSHLAIL